MKTYLKVYRIFKLYREKRKIKKNDKTSFLLENDFNNLSLSLIIMNTKFVYNFLGDYKIEHL